jgi:hypothetical protein
MPGICTCGHKFKKEQLIFSEIDQIFDLQQPKLEITEYQIFKACCPVCGQEQKGIAPEGVNALVTHDNNPFIYLPVYKRKKRIGCNTNQ